ncbi:MAG: MFS transporter [Promethearchaeota archaeon]
MTENNTNAQVSRSSKYFKLMLIILLFVQILDAYTTTYTASFPSKIIEEFLPNYSPNEANSIMALSIGIATIGMYFVFINQFLSDKVGRKTMLFITTLGMGASALLLALSSNIIQYTIFLFLTYLFFSSDMWIIYINEEAESEKRAYYTNLLLAGGVLGPILMPIFRSIFITETSPVGSWRGMTYFPTFLGIPLALIILFTIKETSKYEEIKRGNVPRSSMENSSLLKVNLKYLFTSSRKEEYLAILVMSFLTGLNFIFLQLAESFAASYTTLSESLINIVIYIVAISVIIAYLLTGILADKFGRKPLLYLFSLLMPIGAILLYLGGQMTSNNFIIVVLGIVCGYVAYDALQVLLRIVVFEVVPTDKRGTGSGLRAFTQSLGITLGFMIGSVLTLFFGLGMAFILLSLPLLLNMIFIFKFLKETRGTNLSLIK